MAKRQREPPSVDELVAALETLHTGLAPRLQDDDFLEEEFAALEQAVAELEAQRKRKRVRSGSRRVEVSERKRKRKSSYTPRKKFK